MITDDIHKIGHLIRRAGFGANMDELQRRSTLGVDATLKQLLDDAQKPDDSQGDWLLDYMVQNDAEAKLRPQMLRPWWVYRMVTTNKPLQEKMTLFWHGHFATSANKVNDANLMLQQNRFFRDNALGNWRDMLRGVSRDAAMILWLDNNTNYKAHANENYGRELMELFSLGIGNYTETDVKEGARAFTGWSQTGGNFTFNAAQHDTGLKTFLGHTGNFDGDDVIDIILQQPAAAEFLVRKLFTFFAYSNPEPQVVAQLTQVFRQNNFEIRPLVEAMFKSDAFWSRRAINTQIKSPAQLVVGSLRMLNMGSMMGGDTAGDSMSADPNAGRKTRGIYAAAVQSMRQMGQDLFFPPNVKGWDGGSTWINSATMLERLNFAQRIIAMTGPRQGPGALAKFVTDAGSDSSAAMLDAVLANLGPLEPPAETRQKLESAISLTGVMPAAHARGYERAARIRTLVALTMQTPQYQIC